MKVKLDENLPQQIASVLESLGHDVHTVHDEALIGCPDEEIWRTCQREQRFLITQDLDFSDTRSFAPGNHHGILLVRLQSPAREALIARVVDVFRTEDVTKWAKCFVVASERKVRVRRPRTQSSK